MWDFKIVNAIVCGSVTLAASVGIGFVVARETGTEVGAIAAFRIMSTIGGWLGGNIIQNSWSKPTRPPDEKRNDPFDCDC